LIDTGAQDDLTLDVEGVLTAALLVDEAGCPGSVEDDPGDQCLGDDAEVGAGTDLLGEVGVGGGAAGAGLEDGLVSVGDIGAGTGDVTARPVTRFGEAFEQDVGEAGGRGHVGERHRAAGAAPLRGATVSVLDALVGAQGLRSVPALGSLLGPHVVVARGAAQPRADVQRTRAADDLAPRVGDGAAADPRLLGGLVLPVGLAAVQREEGTLGVTGLVGVLLAGLQEDDLDTGVLAQPGRQDRPGRSGADDDVMGTGHVQQLLDLWRPPVPLPWGGHTGQGPRSDGGGSPAADCVAWFRKIPSHPRAHRFDVRADCP
jgi:hypothetical protein